MAGGVSFTRDIRQQPCRKHNAKELSWNQQQIRAILRIREGSEASDRALIELVWSAMQTNILVFRMARATALGLLGYAIYFGGVYAASIADASITFAEASWIWGGLVAFSLAASELFFFVNAWSLQRRLLRRIILSTGITIASLLIANPICAVADIELYFQRTPRFWPRIVIAAPLFVLFTLSLLRVYQRESRSNQE